MKYINIKKVLAVISAGFIIISMSGCESKEASVSTDNNSQIEIVNEPGVDLKDNSSSVVIDSQTKEEEVIDYFENLESDVEKYVNESNFDKVKDKAKNIAITGIDFIFYGTEIKGVTFEELTDTTKEKIMAIVARIDSKIESKVPNYKDTIKDKFGKGYDYVTDKLHQGIDYVDNKLEEKYGEKYDNVKDKASEIKEEVKEGASEVWDTIKDKTSDGFSKVKDWYEEKTGR